ncbi:MAG TPA: hypothetical protein VK741_10880, partial [Acetobacteraceae bacterium]|nr:hypothetical protein [Acetobacteraceae bacterium]
MFWSVMRRNPNISALLLIVFAGLISSCDAPVRIGVAQARAAGINVTTMPQPGYQQPGHQFAPTGPAPSPPASGSGLIFLPSVPQPHAPDDVVGALLQRDGPYAGPSPVTFGQVFVPGQLSAKSGLAAIVDGHEVPAQLDVKTTNDDGSVRFGVVTLVSAVPAKMMLVKRPMPIGGAVDLAGLQGRYDLAVDIVLHGESGDTPRHFDVAALLSRALAAGKVSYWLRGPLATEARVDVPVESSLHLTFDIRGYADGSTLTDVQFNNDIAMQPVGGTLNYDVTITQHGKPVFQQTAVQHFHYQTWHRKIWSDGDPNVNVVHDVAAMERAGAIWNYDLHIGVPRQGVAHEQSLSIDASYTAILNNAGITKYMPMTGGRGDIGPLPIWDAVWLETQDADAARYSLVQADAAGSVPWHLFDSKTGTYVTTDQYPTLWDDGRAGPNGITALTQQEDGKDGWAVDPAHEPGLSYLAYLETGTRYYLDQLDAQA